MNEYLQYFKPLSERQQRILSEIGTSPGLTEREIAERIFGREGYQQQVNPDCRKLYAQGLVERRGFGGPGDPYRYYIT